MKPRQGTRSHSTLSCGTSQPANRIRLDRPSSITTTSSVGASKLASGRLENSATVSGQPIDYQYSSRLSQLTQIQGRCPCSASPSGIGRTSCGTSDTSCIGPILFYRIHLFVLFKIRKSGFSKRSKVVVGYCRIGRCGKAESGSNHTFQTSAL